MGVVMVVVGAAVAVAVVVGAKSGVEAETVRA